MFDSAFSAFMNEAFEDACVSSTQASWSGSGYSVELFDDGSYRVLWDGNIGNLYDSEGIILGIPVLLNSEWDEDGDHFFDNAKDNMDDIYNQAVEELACAV